MLACLLGWFFLSAFKGDPMKFLALTIPFFFGFSLWAQPMTPTPAPSPAKVTMTAGSMATSGTMANAKPEKKKHHKKNKEEKKEEKK